MAHCHEASLAQHPQMLGHSGLAEAELVDEFTHRPLTGTQQVKQLPAMRVSEDGEGSSHAPNILSRLYSCQGNYPAEYAGERQRCG
jgi:hypothetical protein